MIRDAHLVKMRLKHSISMENGKIRDKHKCNLFSYVKLKQKQRLAERPVGLEISYYPALRVLHP